MISQTSSPYSLNDTLQNPVCSLKCLVNSKHNNINFISKSGHTGVFSLNIFRNFRPCFLINFYINFQLEKIPQFQFGSKLACVGLFFTNIIR